MQRSALAMAAALLLAGTALAAGPANDTGAATVHPELWPAAHSPAAITDAATEARIDALLARMTIAQKVGPLIQADISPVTPTALETSHPGSNLAGGNTGPHGHQRSNAADRAAPTRQLRTPSHAHH